MAVGAAGAAGGLLLAGPVAAVLAAGYGTVAAVAMRGRVQARRRTAIRTAAVDAVATLAADLRAGLAPAPALAEAAPALRPDRGGALAVLPDRAGSPAGPAVARADVVVARAEALVTAALRVAERLGAPLADLLDRVAADLRAAERCRANVAAQTAGAQATAWLLAGLPLAGVGLGYGMGSDPLRLLLHTPLGGVCALAALVLQGAGLAWTAMLCRRAVEEPS